MSEKLSDYDSLGLIIPDSLEERDRILSFIRKRDNKIGNGYHERFANQQTLGYAELTVLETSSNLANSVLVPMSENRSASKTDDLFILFRSQNTGVYKPSEITRALEYIHSEKILDSEPFDILLRRSLSLLSKRLG